MIYGIDAFRSRQLQPALANAAGAMAGEGLQLLDPDIVFLSASAARNLGLRDGDELRLQVGLQPVRFKIAGVLPGAIAERAGFVDIATAQWRFGRLGKLSRLNVRIAPGANHERVREELRAVLSTQARLVTPGQATEYWIGYRNFYVITRYNRSSFYAMAVHDLAQALRSRR